jgi:catechol 2,3-dioxygenase-like lactoylglutathione lyase family enzyme
VGEDPDIFRAPYSSLSLIEFPADDPARARRFWTELLGVELQAREPGEA